MRPLATGPVAHLLWRWGIELRPLATGDWQLETGNWILATENSPSRDSHERQARPWRLLTLGSGLLLAACFFMPVMQGCNAPVIPAQDASQAAAELAHAASTGALNLEPLGALPVFVAAYVFGLLAALAAVAQQLGIRWFTRMCSVLIVGWLVLNCLIIFTAAGVELKQNWPAEWQVYVFGLFVPLLALTYAGFTFGRSPMCALHSRMFLCSLCAFVWFGFWLTVALSGDALYGLYLSFAASCGLLAGSVGQAKVLTRAGWLRTLGRLLTCRLTEPPWEPRCPNCDYLLIGLPEPRCPECGRPFTPAEAATVVSALAP